MNHTETLRSKTLLLVDDDFSNLRILKEILQDEYLLLFAKDGRNALAVIKESLPDLVLLDVQLPEIDGYEVCLELKKSPQTASIPVIFVSSMSEVIDEAYGFETGAVDYITKPVSPAIVKARVATHLALAQKLYEIRQAKQQLRSANIALEGYKFYAEDELERARELMEYMIRNSSVALEGVEIWMQSATDLCGDMILTQKYAGERSYILHADAMGHGLPAALPLMPIVAVFSKMAAQGFTVPAIIREMHNRIIEQLPVGNFVAVTIFSIDYANRSIEIWNGGNPSVVVFDAQGNVLRNLASRHHALGVSREPHFDASTELFHWEDDCWLMLCSDGLTEAQDAQGVCFGEQRILSALHNNQPHQALTAAIVEHLGGIDAHDDISIATVKLNK